MALAHKLASRAAMFGCCSIIALATAAHAAEEPLAKAGGPAQLEEIVVTAQRTEQRLQNVPVAVTALSEAAIEKKSIANIADLQFHVPNMQIRQESVIGGLAIAMRGISVSADNFSFDPSVGVYVNDVFIARANDFGATFYDVHSVQVLRGPQGTFFGRNTPVGAVLVESNGPGASFGGYLKLGVGGGGHGLGNGADRDFHRVDGAVDLPISPVLGLRVAGYYLNDSGWARSRLNGHKFFSSDDGAVRATLDFHPTDRFDARLVVDHSQVDRGGPLIKTLSYLPTGPQPYDQLHGGTTSRDQIIADVGNKDPYTNDSLITQGLKGKESSASLHLSYKLSDDWNIRSISGWRRLHRDQLNDNLGIPAQVGYTSANLRQEQLSQELVLSGNVTPELHLLGGLYYFEETGSDQNTIGSNVLGPPQGLPFYIVAPLNLRGQDIKNTSKAVFLNLSYDILPTLTASVGYRYSLEDKYVFLNSKFLPNQFFPNGIQYTSGAEKFSDKVPLYDAKLNWQAAPDLLFYVKYGTGYRAGGIGFRAVDAQFQPETAATWEGGTKWDFNIGSMPARLNTAIFSSKYDNFQIPVVLLNPVRQTVINAGGAKMKGAEFEFSIRPNSNLDVSASLGLLDAEYTSLIFNNVQLGGLVDLTNNELRDAPKVNFGLSAGYTLDSGIGTWLFQLDYAYKSSYEVDNIFQPNAPGLAKSNDFHQSSTNIVNTRVRLGEAFGSKADVSLWVKNLTDEKVLAFSVGTFGLGEGVYAEPLSFGAELRLPF